MNFRTVHLVTGIVTVLFFLGTGVYLRMNFPRLYEEHEVIRYLFRANHVYLLFSGLLNVLLGLYGPPAETGWRRNVRTAGSILVLFAVPLFVTAFIVEPPLASPARPLTLFGAVAALSGVMFHLMSGRSKENHKL